MPKTPNLGYCYRHTTSNNYVRSEDSLGLCGTHTDFVHKLVVIQIASNWNLSKLNMPEHNCHLPEFLLFQGIVWINALRIDRFQQYTVMFTVKT